MSAAAAILLLSKHSYGGRNSKPLPPNPNLLKEAVADAIAIRQTQILNARIAHQQILDETMLTNKKSVLEFGYE